MKKYSILIAVLMVLSLSFGSLAPQNGYDLFQKALAKERAEGNLEEAIALYQKVIKEASDDSLAAKAQLRIGICYEKLGKQEAQKAYQMVIDNYPQQTDTVKAAKEKLSILMRAKAFAEKGDKEFRIRKVWEYPKLGRGNLGKVSPDGRFLSFSDLGGNIGVYEFATKKRRLITKSFFIAKKKAPIEKAEETSIKGGVLIWAPDGNQIAYSRRKDSELCIFGPNNSGPRVLYKTKNEEEVYPVDWSPDGKFIMAALAENYAAFQAVLISVRNGSARVLKKFDKPPTSEPRRLGIFSPDGKYIAGDFKPQGDSRARDISLLSVDESSEIPLVVHPDDDLTLGWSPDGKTLVFASNRTGTWDVWTIDVVDGKPHGDPKLIKGDIGAMWPLGFTKKGSFYYLLEGALMDVYTATIDSETKKIPSPPIIATQRFVGRNVFPEWSPDGKYLSYVSIRGPGHNRFASRSPICIRSMETGDEREIMPELRYIWGTRWSPDGSFILAVGSEKKDQEGFYKIDAQTGEITSIIQFDSGDIVSEPEWSLDGKKIFYTYKQAKQKYGQIIVYNLETKEKKEIYREEFWPSYIVGRNAFFAHDLALSPDGKLLAFNKGWSPTLMIVPTNGGEPREVLRLKGKGEQISTIAWMPGGQELIFASYRLPGRESDEIWRISVEGGEPKKLGLSKERIHWLSVHPEGERIVFGSSQRIKDVWVMENFLPKEKTKKKSRSN